MVSYKRENKRKDRYDRLIWIEKQMDNRYADILNLCSSSLRIMRSDAFAKDNLEPFSEYHGMRADLVGGMGWSTKKGLSGARVNTVRENMTRAKALLKEINKIEYNVDQALAEDLYERKEEDKLMTLHVEFGNLRKILRRFDDIWKKITKNDKRKRVMRNLKKLSTNLKKEVGKEGWGIIFDKDFSGDGIVKHMGNDVRTFISENEQLVTDIRELHHLTELEQQVVKLLVRGLRKLSRKRREELGKVPDRFTDDLDHFETNLDKKEEAIVVGTITPLVLKIDTIIEEYYALIKEENSRIGPIADYVDHIQRVQKGEEKISEADKRTKGNGLKIAIDRMWWLIYRKEPGFMHEMRELQEDVEIALKKLYALEKNAFDVRGKVRLREKAEKYRSPTKREFPEPEYPTRPNKETKELARKELAELRAKRTRKRRYKPPTAKEQKRERELLAILGSEEEESSESGPGAIDIS